MEHYTKLLNSLAAMASDYWRLIRLYERLIAEAKPDSHNRLKSNYRNAERNLSSILNAHNIKIICYEGRVYMANLAVSVLNFDNFGDKEDLIVDQMIEPTLMLGESVLRMGKAILRKKRR